MRVQELLSKRSGGRWKEQQQLHTRHLLEAEIPLWSGKRLSHPPWHKLLAAQHPAQEPVPWGQDDGLSVMLQAVLAGSPAPRGSCGFSLPASL